MKTVLLQARVCPTAVLFIRPEATGYGAVYYLCEVLKHEKDTIKGKRVALSGFGNVAWGAIKKLTELGAVPLTISGPGGYVYDKDGICTPEKNRLSSLK